MIDSKVLVTRALIILSIFFSVNVHSIHAQELVINEGHSGPVKLIVFSKDNKYMLSGGGNRVKVWDVRTEKLLRTISFPTNKAGYIASYAYDPVEDLVITGHSNGQIHFWKMDTFEHVDELHLGTDNDRGDAIKNMVYLPKERKLAVEIMWPKENKPRFVDMKTRKWAGLAGEYGKHYIDQVLEGTSFTSPPLQGSLSDDDFVKRFVHAKDNSGEQYATAKRVKYKSPYTMYEAKNGAKIRTVYTNYNNGISSMAFSPNGERLVLGQGKEDYGGTQESYDITMWEDGKQVFKSLKQASQYAEELALSPSGRYLVHGGSYNKLFMWDVSKGDLRVIPFEYNKKTSNGRSPSVHGLVFSSDEKYLYTCFYTGLIQKIEVASGQVIKTYEFEGAEPQVNDLTLMNNGRLLVRSKTALYTMDSESLLPTLLHQTVNESIVEVSYSPASDKIIFTDQKRTKIYLIEDSENPQPKEIITNPNFYDISFTADGKRIMVFSSRFKLDDYLFDIEGNLLTSSLNYKGKDAFEKVFPLQNNRVAIVHKLENVALSIHPDDLSKATITVLREDKVGDSEINIRNFTSNAKSEFGVTSNKDGALQYWDLQSGALLASFFVFEEGKEFAIVLPNGYYMSTPNAERNLHFRESDQIITFDQVDLWQNRPDKVIEALRVAKPDQISLFKEAWEKRIRRLGYDPKNFDRKKPTKNLPQLTIKSEIPEAFSIVSQQNLSVTINAKDPKHKLNQLNVWVNGVPIYGEQGLSITANARRRFKKTLSIPLSEGTNNIAISVTNNQGLESYREYLNLSYKPTEPIKPKVHLIAIGVSEFEDADFNLTYAAKDAKDIVDFWKTKVTDKEIIPHLFLNEQALKENILRLKQELMETTEADQVIIFAATHGLVDDNLDYYLAMHSMDFNDPSLNGLAYSDLYGLLSNIPAREKLMLLDACHSGEIDKEESEVLAVTTSQSDDANVKLRGFKRVASKQSANRFSAFELMNKLFADLKQNNGTTVIASASGKEFAFESSEWQNGVFTYALLDGLKNNKIDDENKDKEINLSEIRNYVSEKVRELTNGKQNPASRIINTKNDFGLVEE